MTFTKRTHFNWIICYESWLNVISFTFFTKYFINHFSFTHGVIGFNVQSFAYFTKLNFIHTIDVDSCKFLYGINHGYAFERSFKTDCFLTNNCLISTVHIQTNFLNHSFSEIHHPVVVFIGYINFHACKFRIVRTIHPFVAEVFGEFIHAFKTTYNQSFQIQFIGYTQIQRHIQCIVMGDKRTCCCTSGNGLKDRSFHFDIILRIEIIAHGLIHFGSFNKNIFNPFVDYQIHIPLTVPLFRIFESIKCYSIFVFYNRKRTKRFA